MTIRLEPFAVISRRLSPSEYFHASFGSGPHDPTPFAATYIFEGAGPDFDPDQWKDALAKASAANSGSHLRLLGTSFFARWRADGQRARLRIIDEVSWDGMTDIGASFIDAAPLSLVDGPTVELVLVNKSPRGKLVIIRALHAVMDGRGTLHFLADVFRALRGEALVGTNAAWSDADFLRNLPRAPKSAAFDERTVTERLTGLRNGDDQTDVWKRVSLDSSGTNILGRTAQIVAEYLHIKSEAPAIFSIPVDLRRRHPRVATTTNLFGILLVPISPGENATDFRRKIEAQLEARMDTFYFRGQSLIKLLPRKWFHWAIWRMIRRYNGRRNSMITAGISNQGRLKSQDFSFDSFHSKSFSAIPYPGRTDIVLTGMNNTIELIVRMPKCFANSGRLDDFVTFVQRRLKELDARPTESHQ